MITCTFLIFQHQNITYQGPRYVNLFSDITDAPKWLCILPSCLYSFYCPTLQLLSLVYVNLQYTTTKNSQKLTIYGFKIQIIRIACSIIKIMNKHLFLDQTNINICSELKNLLLKSQYQKKRASICFFLDKYYYQYSNVSRSFQYMTSLNKLNITQHQHSLENNSPSLLRITVTELINGSLVAKNEKFSSDLAIS